MELKLALAGDTIPKRASGDRSTGLLKVEGPIELVESMCARLSLHGRRRAVCFTPSSVGSTGHDEDVAVQVS
jgi:hypothetical protein